MKKLLRTITLTIIIVISCFGQQREPIVVSPLIGAKLDWVEEEFFRIFPLYQSFQEGIFYLNPDSTLDAYISYEYNNLILDTLIKDYISYERLRNYIKYQATDTKNEATKIKRGKYANIFSKRDSVIAGELLSLNKSSTILLNLDKEAYSQLNMPPFNVTYINNTEVSRLIVIEESNIASYIYPLALGIGAGVTAGLIKKAEIESEGPKPLGEGFDDLFTPLLYYFVGGALGALIGYWLSDIFPITTVSESEYNTPFSEKDIIGLREVTRYKDD